MMERLSQGPVSSIMTHDFKFVSPDTIMTEVASIFERSSFHHLPVLDGERRPVGVISRHDYHQIQHHFTHFAWRNPEQHNAHFFSTLLASEVMSTEPITLAADASVENAIEIFLENKVHSILILDGEHCAGILTPFDILKAIKTTATS